MDLGEQDSRRWIAAEAIAIGQGFSEPSAEQ